MKWNTFCDSLLLCTLKYSTRLVAHDNCLEIEVRDDLWGYGGQSLPPQSRKFFRLAGNNCSKMYFSKTTEVRP